MTNNDKVIKNRWKYTDKILNDVDKSLNNIFDDIKDELIELFNEFNVSSEDLNKTVSPQIKRKYERSKREWKKQGLITPYFRYLIDTTTKLTYSNLINLFILAIYLKYQKKEFDITKNLLVNVANDTYKQAKQDLRKEDDDSIPKKLTWKDIAPWAIVMTIGVSIYEYLNILNQLASEDSKKIYLTLINQEITPEEKYLTKELKIQKNRLLKINGEKRSGVLENMSRQIGNKAYVEPFLNEKVKFIAEMDDRTTPMCRSLNGQIFNTKDWNDFWRYSDVRKDKKKYHIFGLKEGVNMPPIEDHFHWCRSTIRYINKDYYAADITHQWLNEKFEKDIPIEENREYAIGPNGKIYRNGVDGVKLQFKPDKGAKDVAEWLKEIKGGKIVYNSKIDYPDGIPTADLEYNYKQLEVKSPTGNSRWTIKNQFRTPYQADTYVLDITNSEIEPLVAIERVQEVFSLNTRNWIEMIIIKKDNDLIGVFKRIEEGIIE